MSDNEANTLEQIRTYWQEHIHDLVISTHRVGTEGFFDDLEQYRFEKLSYLPKVVNFADYKGKNILEVGCGIGIDLVRFAREGAIVKGIDLAEQSIDLAKKNFKLHKVNGDLRVMNGEDLEFEDNSFDMVYAHGVIQYTADDQRMVNELFRLLKTGGEAIMVVYNKYSWLNLLSILMGVELEHEDAPVLRKYTIWGFRRLLYNFSKVDITLERFPVKTRLHHGIKAQLYNSLFVSLFNLIPLMLTRPMGWHIIVKATK